MKKKEKVDIIIALSLIVLGSVILIFPLINVVNVKYVFMGAMVFYGIMNLIKFYLTSNEKDFEGLLVMIASILTLLLLGLINVEEKPVNLALVLFTWIIIMSMIKLKKCDYYHDLNNRVFIYKMISLIIFILIGLLASFNLYYSKEVQVLVLGFFYFINGVLELFDPFINYLLYSNKK